MKRFGTLGVALLVALVAAAPARAAFGDGFGIAPALGPALPGPSSFWAGTCSRATAPGIGVPIPPDGVGVRGATTMTKSNNSQYINPSSPGTADVVPSPALPAHCVDHGAAVQGWPAWADEPAGGPVEGAPQWRLPAVTEAGAHPDGSATLTFAREPDRVMTNGSVDNVSVELPAGFLGDPRAVPKCTAEQFDAKPVQCPAASQVGVSEIALRSEIHFAVQSFVYPVYNLEPRKGKTAEFGIPDVNDFTTVRVVAKARTNGDFGVTTFVPQIPAALDLYSQTVTLWGVPWAAANDRWRVEQGADIIGGGLVNGIPQSGLDLADQVSYEPSWGEIRPLISNPTECSGSTLETKLATDAYQNPGAFTFEGDPDLADLDWKTTSASAPAVTDCEVVPFDPDMEIEPTSTGADSATGLNARLTVPQNDDPPAGVAHDPDEASGAPAHWRGEGGRATSQLNRAVVTLPLGVSVNPSGATGLEGCSDDQIGVRQQGNPPLFNNEDPFDGIGPVECPAGSRIGTVEVDTPVLEEPLNGIVVLGTPKSTDPQSGQMLRMFIVVEDEERGLIAKISGSAVADPETGQLTATFDRNPRVPFEQMRLSFKGGDRGLLAMPQDCGAPQWSSLLTPWSAPDGSVPDGAPFAVGGDCDLDFAPTLEAGMSNAAGGGNGTFSFTVARNDGQQWIEGISAELPKGLLASIRDVPLCSSAQAAAGACPPESRIGTVDASAGSGTPFVLERKGDAYLTEGYKGAPFGMLTRVPVEAGPFRGELALTPIAVRQALFIDPNDAHGTVVSDPLPRIWHGIPVRARRVTVSVDRPAFMVNPTDCSPKQVSATIASTRGATASLATPFQARDCGRLAFRPKTTMRLVGRRQTKTGQHPAFEVRLTQSGRQANVKRAEARMPLSLALDPRNSADPKLLCGYDAGLQASCPASSVIGRASAVSPLLKRPLTGPVHLVQGIKFGPNGNRIRTLPTLLVKLSGEVSLNLRGVSSVQRGRLVGTFSSVPDAQVSSFDIRINGGPKGILVITRTARGKAIDICAPRRKAQIAQLDLDAHNGRRHDTDVKLALPCKKRAQVKRKRSAAKRRAAKRRSAVRRR